jgi:putative transposase
MIYHVINRASARLMLFDTQEDYQLIFKTLQDAKEKYNMRILAYCIMPNHFHLLLYPEHDGDLSKFMYWFTMTHTQRWHAMHNTFGSGHIYQGRYKSFLVSDDEYYLTLVRYIERNPLRAKIVRKLVNWKWGSYHERVQGKRKLLDTSPVPLPKQYEEFVITAVTPGELKSIRQSISKGKPYGNKAWQDKMVDRFNLEMTLRGRGRPKGSKKGS